MVWPGLGQAYRGDRRAALLFGLPPLLVAVAIGALALLIGPPVFVAHLLNPVFSLMAGLLVVAWGLLWAISIIDAGRPHSRPSMAVGVLGLAVVLLVTGWAGSGVWALYEAGNRISQPLPTPTTPEPSDRPSTSPSPTGPVTPGSPGPSPGGSPTRPTPSPSPNLDATGRVTVLFLGADLGRGVEGRLTDTIQVASFDQRTGRIAVISVPRDTGQLPLYNGGTWNRKINELMTHAADHSEEFPDGGLGTLERQLEYIIGIPIDYYAAVDFSGFERLVDMVGGVAVTLNRPIADASYSNGPNRPRGFFLEAGDHHLDGRTALAYVRSRKGPGNSDFQRARRQQQVLLALRHKVNDPLVLANVPSIVEAASQMVRTNAPLERLPQIVGILQASTDAEAETYVLQPRQYAEVVPRSEIGPVYMTRLKMDAVAELSIRLFGEDSRYAQEHGGGRLRPHADVASCVGGA